MKPLRALVHNAHTSLAPDKLGRSRVINVDCAYVLSRSAHPLVAETIVAAAKVRSLGQEETC